MFPVRTILHPTDFSEHADHAYRLARLIARDCGARLIVLHVAGMNVDVTPVVYTEMGIPFFVPGDFERHRAALLGQLHEKFETDPEFRAETRLTEGDAAEGIVRVADEVGCDLIVMGTHGRSGLGRLLLGSVAEVVLRKATCPVLTLKSPAQANPIEPSTPDREGATA